MPEGVSLNAHVTDLLKNRPGEVRKVPASKKETLKMVSESYSLLVTELCSEFAAE